MYILLIASLLLQAGTALAEEKIQDPFVGKWIGQYQTRQALEGRLTFVVSKDSSTYELTVTSSNEHYPSDEPENLLDYSIDGDKIWWVLMFGPNRVEWTGERKGDFIVGELTGTGQHHGGFKGYWTAVRAGARVKPRN